MTVTIRADEHDVGWLELELWVTAPGLYMAEALDRDLFLVDPFTTDRTHHIMITIFVFESVIDPPVLEEFKQIPF